MIDAFLERLSKALVGATDDQLKTVSAGNSGCMVFILIALGVGISTSISAAILF
jgi:hypothetical protein